MPSDPTSSSSDMHVTFADTNGADQPMTTRSVSVPFPRSHVTRTQSELDLDLNTAIAERRDEKMFNLIVKGIRERQTTSDEHLLSLSGASVKNIVHTRLCNLDQSSAPAQELSPDDSHNWQLADPIQGHSSSETANEDEWSISGFDPMVHSNAAGFTEDLQPIASRGGPKDEDGDDDGGEDGDDIFQLDL